MFVGFWWQANIMLNVFSAVVPSVCGLSRAYYFVLLFIKYNFNEWAFDITIWCAMQYDTLKCIHKTRNSMFMFIIWIFHSVVYYVRDRYSFWMRTNFTFYNYFSFDHQTYEIIFLFKIYFYCSGYEWSRALFTPKYCSFLNYNLTMF